MLVDDVKIHIKAGDGGRGAVSFNKIKMSLGPVGGSGGRGGSVYAEGVSNLNALNKFRFKKDISSNDGKDGRGQFRDGVDGEDTIIQVPVGTVVHNLDSGKDTEVVKIGERVLLAKGGRGGKGNFHFRSATNTSPKEFQYGVPGEEFNIRLELKLIADVGFIGLPNVGKSSLLNELTRAQSKVANYPFTTLEPNLGTYYELILADLPGLIEGASYGKGLGVKFLRHVERTRILFHFVSADSVDTVKDYKVIRRELEEYSPELAKKPEYLFLSKSDEAEPKEVKSKLAKLKKLNSTAVAISILDEESLDKVRDTLSKIANEKRFKD